MKVLITGIALCLLVTIALPGLSKSAAPVVRPAFAQDGDSCPALVQQALSDVETACAALGRNEACYGNTRVQAQPDELAFAAPGDLVDVSTLEGLQLSSMDVATSEWGISLLQLQASLPDDSAENVELVLFGNVEITQTPVETPEQPAPIVLNVAPAAQNNVNIRGGASTNDAIVGTLASGQSLITDGRNEAGDWLRVQLSDGSGTGWVFAELVSVDGDSSTLPVISSDAPVSEPEASASPYGPMQAFYLRSGAADRPCEEAPDSGLLIQTPAGQGEITFLINEVTIDLGSTAYLQAQPAGEMTVSVVEGRAKVTAQGVIVLAPAGTRVRIPLDANGIASAPPFPAEAYDGAALAVLPIALLTDTVPVAAPPTDDELAALFSGLPSTGNWQLTYGTEQGDCPAGIIPTSMYLPVILALQAAPDGTLTFHRPLISYPIGSPGEHDFVQSPLQPDGAGQYTLDLTQQMIGTQTQTDPSTGGQFTYQVDMGAYNYHATFSVLATNYLQGFITFDVAPSEVAANFVSAFGPDAYGQFYPDCTSSVPITLELTG